MFSPTYRQEQPVSQLLRKAAHPTIDPQDPWKDDPFERRRVGDVLTKMIVDLDEPFVIAVNGGWGSGKSTFLARLTAHLRGQAPRVPCVTVNAWGSDWMEDPLLALSLGLSESLKDAGKDSEQKVGNALVGHALQLVPPVVGALANLKVPGSGAQAAAIAKVGADAITRARERAAAKRGFVESVKEARNLLTDRKPNEPIKKHVVIVIDELDRCRPDYAVRMLERIKHLYSVPGLIFVIATDHVNLRSAVKSVYGPETDGERYLRKFFDFEMQLRPPSVDQYLAVLTAQWKIELGQAGAAALDELRSDTFDATVINAEVDWAEALYEFGRSSEVFGLSLRDQAQAFSLMYAMMAAGNSDALFLPALIAYLACLRFGHEQAFARVRARGVVGLQEVFDNPKTYGDPGDYFKGIINVATMPEVELQAWFATVRRNYTPHAYRLMNRMRRQGSGNRRSLRKYIADLVFLVGDLSLEEDKQG